MSIHQTYINNDALKRVTADDALKRVTAVGDEGISFKMHVWLTHIHVLLHIYIYRIKLSAEYSLMKQNCLNAYPILVRICRLLSNMSRQHIMLMLVWQYVYIFENNEQTKNKMDLFLYFVLLGRDVITVFNALCILEAYILQNEVVGLKKNRKGEELQNRGFDIFALLKITTKTKPFHNYIPQHLFFSSSYCWRGGAIWLFAINSNTENKKGQIQLCWLSFCLWIRVCERWYSFQHVSPKRVLEVMFQTKCEEQNDRTDEWKTSSFWQTFHFMMIIWYKPRTPAIGNVVWSACVCIHQTGQNITKHYNIYTTYVQNTTNICIETVTPICNCTMVFLFCFVLSWFLLSGQLKKAALVIHVPSVNPKVHLPFRSWFSDPKPNPIYIYIYQCTLMSCYYELIHDCWNCIDFDIQML